MLVTSSSEIYMSLLDLLHPTCNTVASFLPSIIVMDFVLFPVKNVQLKASSEG